jgi:homoserine dehydrogenase
LELKKVLVREIKKKRPVEIDASLLTNDPEEIFRCRDIDIVIELVGGEHPAAEYVRQALISGRHVVTANKEVLAKHGYELLSLAREHKVELRYEASVGSGIPLITPLQEQLAGNRILAIYGILNGTTNYILTRMAEGELDFAAALKEAQKLGYAEPDPKNDIDGIDAAYKLIVLSNLAYRAKFRLEDVYCEGISSIAAQDFRYAREFGYAIKLLAIAKRDDDEVELRVHPAFVPQESQLAKVDGVYNAVQIEGDLVGKIVFYGEGAGSLRAASAVIADTLAIARNICRGTTSVPELRLNHRITAKPISDVRTRYYFRLNVPDRPGVLAQISRVFGDNGISISSVIQKESDLVAQTAVLVIMTHEAEERAVQKALKELRQLPVVSEIGNFVRVEG